MEPLHGYQEIVAHGAAAYNQLHCCRCHLLLMLVQHAFLSADVTSGAKATSLASNTACKAAHQVRNTSFVLCSLHHYCLFCMSFASLNSSHMRSHHLRTQHFRCTGSRSLLNVCGAVHRRRCGHGDSDGD